MNTQTNLALEEDFSALLEESLSSNKRIEGSVIKGRIISIDRDFVMVDVGLKSEGRISVKEFSPSGHISDLKAGDIIDVFVERMEDKNGEVVLSREKAKREALWVELEGMWQNNQQVTGTIFGRVKGGFTVDINGTVAFLPGSQVDVRPIKDLNSLLGMTQPFMILKMDRPRGNIVVSRKALMEDVDQGTRLELLANITEGQSIEGMVKNITDYGAFIDLGGIDGLLHVTDLSWKRVNHPSEILTVGQTLMTQVIRFNKETNRISLGLKQLQNDPWVDAEKRFVVGEKIKGSISNITDYGAFVDLGNNIEGLIHVSEMSWTKKNIHPSRLVNLGDQTEVVILDLDMTKRRISLGLKQCSNNPWEQFQVKHPISSDIEGEIRSITEFGVFIALGDGIDGMIHINDLTWDNDTNKVLSTYKKGDMIKARVRDIDVEKERVNLSVKHLSQDPLANSGDSAKKGEIVTCTITSVTENGLDVEIPGGVPGFIKKIDLARERSEQRTDRFAVGEKIDAKVMGTDKASRKVTLSIKAHEMEEEKQAMKEFGSTDSGASLGDILGAAIQKAAEK